MECYVLQPLTNTYQIYKILLKDNDKDKHEFDWLKLTIPTIDLILTSCSKVINYNFGKILIEIATIYQSLYLLHLNFKHLGLLLQTYQKVLIFEKNKNDNARRSF